MCTLEVQDGAGAACASPEIRDQNMEMVGSGSGIETGATLGAGVWTYVLDAGPHRGRSGGDSLGTLGDLAAWFAAGEAPCARLIWGRSTVFVGWEQAASGVYCTCRFMQAHADAEQLHDPKLPETRLGSKAANHGLEDGNVGKAKATSTKAGHHLEAPLTTNKRARGVDEGVAMQFEARGFLVQRPAVVRCTWLGCFFSVSVSTRRLFRLDGGRRGWRR